MPQYNNGMRDVLAYTGQHSGASIDMAGGVVRAVVAMLMQERHLTFEEAILEMKRNLPKDYRFDCIPEAWQTVFIRGY